MRRRLILRRRVVERLHGTLKDRLRPMRGLKNEETVRIWLEGWVVHYNYVRRHQSLKGKTPAETSGIEGKGEWHTLIGEAIRRNTEIEMTQREEEMTVVAK